MTGAYYYFSQIWLSTQSVTICQFSRATQSPYNKTFYFLDSVHHVWRNELLLLTIKLRLERLKLNFWLISLVTELSFAQSYLLSCKLMLDRGLCISRLDTVLGHYLGIVRFLQSYYVKSYMEKLRNCLNRSIKIGEKKNVIWKNCSFCATFHTARTKIAVVII